MTEKSRSHITRIVRQEGPIADLTQRFGWKAFVTNAPQEQLALAAAVLCYRNAYRVERLFHAVTCVSPGIGRTLSDTVAA